MSELIPCRHQGVREMKLAQLICQAIYLEYSECEAYERRVWVMINT